MGLRWGSPRGWPRPVPQSWVAGGRAGQEARRGQPSQQAGWTTAGSVLSHQQGRATVS